MAIIGIAAVDRNGAIAKNGGLPWHYPADSRFFREQTTGHSCVMGYRTWLTLERPLNDRLNIILSRRSEVEPQPGVVVLRDHQSVLSLTRYLSGDLFVVGGEQIYRTFLEDIERWVVTEIPLAVEGADTFMPDRYLNDFEVYDSRDLGDGLIVKFYGRVGSTST